MTGIGGGSLMTPLLILVFGVKPITAVGTDLAYGAVTKTVGGVKHFRQGTVDMTLSGWMALGSIPAAIGGVYVLEALEQSQGEDFDDLLILLLAIALLFCGVMTLARALFLKASSAASGKPSRWRRATRWPPLPWGCSSASSWASPRPAAGR